MAATFATRIKTKEKMPFISNTSEATFATRSESRSLSHQEKTSDSSTFRFGFLPIKGGLKSSARPACFDPKLNLLQH